MSSYESRLERAQELDKKYPSYAHLFEVPTFESMGTSSLSNKDSPKNSDGTSPNITYFVGNSLGLMPKATVAAVTDELKAWGSRGVVGHFRRDDFDGLTPWADIDLPIDPLLAPILGAAEESEVALMNTLTGNLHTLVTAFYKPSGKRYKIMMEEKAFPSDQYALQGQVRLHGYDPKDAIIEVAPREGEHTLRTSDILDLIEKNKDEIAIVLFSGVQYYTGQFFDIEKITKAGKAAGAIVGWDLAHATGNVPLKLHDWDADFAMFCTYKYLNSGPGSIGGIFLHSKHGNDSSRPRLAGWWGNDSETRFQMSPEFIPIPGAKGFRMSNPTVLSVVCVEQSLKIFQEAGGIEKLRERSLSMTNLLFELLEQSKYYVPVERFDEAGKNHPNKFTIITPADPNARGAQLSLLFSEGIMLTVFDELEKQGIVGDERKPSVIRLAPNHLYNTHAEVVHVVDSLDKILSEL